SYGIFAVSLAFLWGQTGLLCFGQAIFFGVGAYVMALITKGMVSGVGDSTVIGLLAATLLAALVALAAGLLVFRGRGLSGAYFAIVTLSAAVIAERAASHSRFIGGVHGLLPAPPAPCGGVGGRALRDPVRVRLAGADRCAAFHRSADLDRAGRPRGPARRFPRRARRALGRKPPLRGAGVLLAPRARCALHRFGRDLPAGAAGTPAVAAATPPDGWTGRASTVSGANGGRRKERPMGKIVFAAAMSHVLDPDYYQAACGLTGRRKVEACMAEIEKL